MNPRGGRIRHKQLLGTHTGGQVGLGSRRGRGVLGGGHHGHQRTQAPTVRHGLGIHFLADDGAGDGVTDQLEIAPRQLILMLCFQHLDPPSAHSRHTQVRGVQLAGHIHKLGDAGAIGDGGGGGGGGIQRGDHGNYGFQAHVIGGGVFKDGQADTRAHGVVALGSSKVVAAFLDALEVGGGQGGEPGIALRGDVQRVEGGVDVDTGAGGGSRGGDFWRRQGNAAGFGQRFESVLGDEANAVVGNALENNLARRWARFGAFGEGFGASHSLALQFGGCADAIGAKEGEVRPINVCVDRGGVSWQCGVENIPKHEGWRIVKKIKKCRDINESIRIIVQPVWTELVMSLHAQAFD